MRVLIAGASGTIGLPIVRLLVSWGHDVSGLTRNVDNAARLEAEEAKAIVTDVLDSDDVMRAVASAGPEVVIDQLTALPRHYTPEAMRDTLSRTSEVRVVGGANVQAAALAAGATRFLAQSGCYFYQPGEGLAEETEPFVFDGPPLVARNVEAFQKIEDRLLSLPDGTTGLALRYGFYYGPGTWYSSDGDMGEQARAGQLGVLGSGDGVWSFVHLEDAAEFTARAAVESEASGAVNVTDSDPLPMRDAMSAFARYSGGKQPTVYPITEETDKDGVFYATQLRGASNRRAREEFHFNPRRLEWLDQKD
jgi:2-alkyl-3-oxoalkanoate reductase